MLKGIQQFLFYRFSAISKSETVKNQIMEENRRFAIVWASFQLLYWLYCLVMSFRVPDFMVCRNIYLAAFLVNVVSLSLAVFAAPKAPRLIRLICIAVDIALLGAGIGIARLLAPKTIVIFASVIIVPVFFICDTLSSLFLLILNAAVFTFIGIHSMEPETFRWTLTNMLIFSSVGLILGYFVNKARFERYFYAESAMQLADSNARLAELQANLAYYDQMTGLRNRRPYAEKIDQYMEHKPNDCVVVMLDINGLKATNDTKGHAAGDELIIGAAKCLQESFSEGDLIYRIGGDEFCVITKGTAEQAGECLNRLETIGRKWKGQYINGISMSYGYASDRECDDFESMLKAADQNMYAFKRNYYLTSGNDRRHP